MLEVGRVSVADIIAHPLVSTYSTAKPLADSTAKPCAYIADSTAKLCACTSRWAWRSLASLYTMAKPWVGYRTLFDNRGLYVANLSRLSSRGSLFSTCCLKRVFERRLLIALFAVYSFTILLFVYLLLFIVDGNVFERPPSSNTCFCQVRFPARRLESARGAALFGKLFAFAALSRLSHVVPGAPALVSMLRQPAPPISHRRVRSWQ